MNIFDGKIVYLRPLEPVDIDLLYKWENNSEIWHLSNTLVPFSRHIIKQYIESSVHDIYTTKQLRLIIEQKPDNKPVGAIDIFDFSPYHLRAGIGILIAEQNARKKGFANEALQIVIKYSFSLLNLKQLYCNIEPDNVDSLYLFQNNGFEVTGTKKSWLKSNTDWKDELFLQLINKGEFSEK
ncbi:MAG: GNAT family N-acetyltransferase [Chlorobi bacterium]|nr:GNAT family N-acetyltransferase [Chlorobiota bacterium]